MPSVQIPRLEKLRRIWTPGREIEEIVAQLNPQTELDSMVRKFLHLILVQNGPQTIDLGSVADPMLMFGSITWEIIHGPGPEHMPEIRRRQATLWVERNEDDVIGYPV